jgi:hypothetical protein
MDPSAFAPFDLGNALAKRQQLEANQQQFQDRRRLSDLLPKAVHGDQGAIDQIAGINPQLFMHLDDRQREQAKAELADITGAVRWALSDPNEKAVRWNQVVDFYAPHAPQIAQYRDHPELAESALLQLGQIGEYLNGAPKGTALQQNYQFFAEKDPKLADQYLHNQAEGSPMIASNGDGTFTIIPRGYGTAPAPQQGGGMPRVNSPEDAAKLPPGTQFIMPDGRIGTVPGGAGGNASGGFPGGY